MPWSLIVIGWPKRSRLRPAATRIHPSETEYSISEGWIRVAAGRSRDRYGQPMTIKLQGKVEPYFERPSQDEEGPASEG